MGNLTEFNNNGIDPSEGNFEPLPQGNYKVWITASETQRTKAGNGSFLKLTLQVIEGEFENRLLFVRLNIDNPSNRAVSIAKAELQSICKAVNRTGYPDDSSELHDKPFAIFVILKDRKDGDGKENVIKKYMVRSTEEFEQSSDTPWL
jgi:Protein of unknown function (DUF669)